MVDDQQQGAVNFYLIYLITTAVTDEKWVGEHIRHTHLKITL